MDHDQHQMIEGVSSQKEYLKFFGLLFGIGIMAFSVANFDGEVQLGDFMQWFMGIFFLVFGAFKLVDLEMFVEMFRMYDIPAKKFRFYAWVYPFIEIGLGLLYITNFGGNLRDLVTLIVIGIGAYGVSQHMGNKAIQCACLGNVIRLPLSKVTLYEDLGMAVMAGLMLIGV